MMCLSVDHPDIEEFITIKSDTSVITNANISVKITNKFMEAVKDNTNWTMEFHRPETNEKIIKTIQAKKLLRLIAEQMHKTGEPGVLFIDTINNYHLLKNCDDYVIESPNP